MRKGKDQVCKLSVQIYVYTIWNHERSALRFYLKDPPLHGVDNPKQTASENANTLKRVCHALGHKDPVALELTRFDKNLQSKIAHPHHIKRKSNTVQINMVRRPAIHVRPCTNEEPFTPICLVGFSSYFLNPLIH